MKYNMCIYIYIQGNARSCLWSYDISQVFSSKKNTFVDSNFHSSNHQSGESARISGAASKPNSFILSCLSMSLKIKSRETQRKSPCQNPFITQFMGRFVSAYFPVPKKINQKVHGNYGFHKKKQNLYSYIEDGPPSQFPWSVSTRKTSHLMSSNSCIKKRKGTTSR